MNGRKLSVNKACLFLAVLLLVAMGTVSAALYGLTQNITAVWYVVLFGIFVLLCAVCFMVLVNNGGRATAARDFSPPRTGKVPILAAAEPSL